MTLAVVTGAVTIRALSHECKRKKKKEAERRQTHNPLHLPVQRAPCQARSPIGVPPRFSPKGLSIPKAHLGPGFVRRMPRAGDSPPASVCTSSDAPRVPVIVPAGMMPETPGSGGDEPPPAGTASRSISPCPRLTSFT